MKKLITTSLVILSLIGVSVPVLALANPSNSACQGISATGADCGSGEENIDTFLDTVVDVLLFVVGAVSVIMLVIGGIRYVASGGDANATASAKNTIMYAVIGLIVAFLAYAAINFVLDELTG